MRLGELLDIGRHPHGRNALERQPVGFAPIGEAIGGGEVGPTRVGVADVSGEEFPEALFGLRRVREQRRRGCG